MVILAAKSTDAPFGEVKQKRGWPVVSFIVEPWILRANLIVALNHLGFHFSNGHT